MSKFDRVTNRHYYPAVMVVAVVLFIVSGAVTNEIADRADSRSCSTI